MYIKNANGLQVGVLYIGSFRDSTYYESHYMVCLGKYILGNREGRDYLFAVFDEDISNMVEEAEKPLYAVEKKVHLLCVKMSDFNGGLRVCGEEVIKEKTEQGVKQWLTQLQLSGCEIKGTIEPLCYLGDWLKRKKLPCVKNFEVGRFYVKEPVGYFRERIKYFNGGRIWCYAGKEGNVFVWYETYTCNIGHIGQFNNKNSIRHEVKKQYTDMVEW